MFLDTPKLFVDTQKIMKDENAKTNVFLTEPQIILCFVFCYF